MVIDKLNLQTIGYSRSSLPEDHITYIYVLHETIKSLSMIKCAIVREGTAYPSNQSAMRHDDCRISVLGVETRERL